MNQSLKVILSIIVLILILGGVLFFMKRDTDYMSITSFEECRTAGYTVTTTACTTPDGRTFPAPQATSTPSGTATTTTGTPTTTTPTTSGNATSNEIRNVNVVPNQILSSPLIITGEARAWYFEASFPAQLLDGNGIIIAQGPAQAQDDWMTTNFVPFKAMLTFAKPATATGTLVLRNDNPSGMPELDRYLYIPIRFR